MLRKYLRRVLPSHQTVRENRYVARFGHRLQHHNLWHLHRRSVAGGVAAGLFAGLIPGSNPVQFTAGAVLALALKVNLPLAVLVTLYSNPFTIVPLYLLAFKLGQRVLMQGGSGGIPAFTPDFGAMPLMTWIMASLEWLLSAGKPLLIGIPLLAALLAAAGYLVTDLAWRLGVRWQWHQRRKKRTREYRL